MKKLSLFSGEGLMGDSVGHQIYKAAAEFFEQGGQWESGLTRKIGTNVFTLDDVVLQLTRGFENEIFEDINRLMQRETGLGLVLTNDLTTMTKERIVQLCNDIASSRELYG